MSVNTPQLQIKPYESTVPTLQLPPDVVSGETRPSGPLAGQFGKKGTGALAIGDAIFKGVMLGHAEKEKRKAEQAEATISAADKATDAAYSQYQDALTKAGGNVNDAKAKAAYDAYLGVFNQSKQAKAQFVIPDKGKGGQKVGGQSKDGKKQGPLGGIKEFFEANPHIVPQIALLAMQPKAPGLSQEAKTQMLQDTALEQRIEEGKQNLEIGKQNISLNDQQLKQNQEAQQRAAMERKVEESGGIENVLKNKDASPDLKQTASRMKYEALDKESPEGRLKNELTQKVLSGQSLTPQERIVAGSFGIMPKPEAQTIQGKNGHQQLVYIDPSTGQPVAGMKPLDLGPPAWAEEFYAKRAADKRDVRTAIESDPAAWGVHLGTDEKANRAAIDAKTEVVFAAHEMGLHNLSALTGKTGYETQRDSDQIQGLLKTLGMDGSKKGSWLDSDPPTLAYPDGKKTAVGSTYMKAMLNEFFMSRGQDGGVYGYRTTPPVGGVVSEANPDGKSAETLEAERRFLYQFMKNHLMTQKGKLGMTSDQADAFLQQTALGQPITSQAAQSSGTMQRAGGIEPPPQAPNSYSGAWPGAYGKIEPPPQVGQQNAEPKLYMIPGVSGPVQLSGDDLAKLKANNIPVEEMSPDLMNQFLGQ